MGGKDGRAMPRFFHRCYRSLCDDVETRKAAEQFIRHNPKHLSHACTPPGYSTVSSAESPVFTASIFTLSSPLTVCSCLPRSHLPYRHASQLELTVAGSSSPCLEIKHAGTSIKSLCAFSPCTMHCVHRITIPPPVPVAPRCITCISHFLHVDEQTEGQGPKNAPRASGGGCGGRRRRA
jgi:hypothetical protein